jgi:hypothetical protein
LSSLPHFGQGPGGGEPMGWISSTVEPHVPHRYS